MYYQQGYDPQNIYQNNNNVYRQNYPYPYPNKNQTTGYANSNLVYPPNNNPSANTNNIYSKNIQTISLEQALTQSSYPKNRHKLLRDLLLCEYIGNPEAKVYFQYMSQEKLFVVLYILSIPLGQKKYNIEIYMYIPRTYPDSSPEFYIMKIKGTSIHDYYIKNKIINGQTFQIYIDKISKFNPTKINISEIINALKNHFNEAFPIFKDKNLKTYDYNGKNYIDKNTLKEIIIKSDNFNEAQLLHFMRNKAKNLVNDLYYKYNKKYNPKIYYDDLRQMKMELDSSSNSGKNPMNKQVESLRKIKGELNKIEKDIKADIQNISNSKRNALTKCDELIKIKNENDLKLLIKRKILEDYLIFLKKGYEKKVVSLHEMLEQTRMLTREILSIDYLRQKLKYC
jgi:hypothetical protein